MAIKRTAYSCEFKCGWKVALSKKSIEAHELICFKNPAMKSCQTCKFFEKEHDSNGMDSPNYEEWINLICHAEDEVIHTLQNNCDKYEQIKVKG